MYGRALRYGGYALIGAPLMAILARVLTPLIDQYPASANGGVVMQALQVVNDHALFVILLACALGFVYGAFIDRKTVPEVPR